MAELRPIPLSQLLRRVMEEPARQQSIFDLPLRKCWRPRAGIDLSVDVHGERAQSPIGPAAGPHAQLAQNIVLSWLGGSRIIELKTVQILDALQIPRPCIDAATVGFNVEWSQELPLADSIREYVAGWMLLRILRELDPLGFGAEIAAKSDPIFELSVGYDLKGLQQPRMREYLSRVKDVAPIIDSLRMEIPVEQGRLRDLDYRPRMVSCVTLSTFHGCPPGEIEAIARYLLDEHDFDVIVKLNPTLLGYGEVCHLLHDRMGYHELRPRESAFEGDLKWDEAIALGRRMSAHAASLGRSFGVKMTNTLVVENHKKFFAEKEMYLSGPPLHVLAMHCADRWRAALGGDIPLSFSGGIDQHNVVDAVACDLVPVTTCTDLLKAGGYGRLPRYLENLEEAMTDLGAPDREELILRRFSQGAEAVRGVFSSLREEEERFAAFDAEGRETAERLLSELEGELLHAAKSGERTLAQAIAGYTKRLDVKYLDIEGKKAGRQALAARAVSRGIANGLHARIVREAGVLNGHEAAARVTGDPRYAAGKNGKPPRKVGSMLVLLDCLSCDKCVPVCPNDANFSIATPLEEIVFSDLVVDGDEVRAVPGAGTWKVEKPRQWANLADACNECGNCDVFCPEDGGPYIVKARFFGSRASFEESAKLDGLFIDENGAGMGSMRVSARIGGVSYELSLSSENVATLEDGGVRVEYHPMTGEVLRATRKPGAGASHRLSGAAFLTLRALVRGALDDESLNPVNARLPSLRWPEIAS